GTGVRSGGPHSTINPLSTMTLAGEILSRGVYRVPASIARNWFLLTAGTEVGDDLSEIAGVFRQQPFRFFAVASERAHHDRHLQIAAGHRDQLLQLVGVETQDFAQDLHAALAQLLIRHTDVDHPVAVGHAETDHYGRADHVQDHLLGGARLHPG